MELCKIGDIAKALKTSPRTIRFYEEQNLIQPDGKTEGGYRLYSRDTVEKLRFICTLRDIGFSVKEIRKLISARTKGSSAGDRLNNILEVLAERLAETRDKLKMLDELQADLEDAMKILQSCNCDQLPYWEQCQHCRNLAESSRVPHVLRAILK